jgi:hypothetical protein
MKSLRSFRLAFLVAQRLARLLVFKLVLLAQLAHLAQLAPRVRLAQQVLQARKAIRDKQARKAQLVILALLVQQALQEQQALLVQPDQQDLRGLQVQQVSRVIPARKAKLGLLVQQGLLVQRGLKVFKASLGQQVPVVLAFNILVLLQPPQVFPAIHLHILVIRAMLMSRLMTNIFGFGMVLHG